MKRGSHAYVETREDDEYCRRSYSNAHRHASKQPLTSFPILIYRIKIGNGFLIYEPPTMSVGVEATDDVDFARSLHASFVSPEGEGKKSHAVRT